MNDTRKCACKARYVPLQVMDLQVKYHYYTMCTLQDMDLTQKFNHSQWCIKCRSKWAKSQWAVKHYPRRFHGWSIIIITQSKHFVKSDKYVKLYSILALLLRHTTGHSEQPSVQQQHIQPQNNHLTFIGRDFFRTPLSRTIVALYSSGATCKC